jgi:hypothetical protein
LTQTFSASYDRTVDAARSALESLDLPIKKETKEADVAQFRSEAPDGKEIWVDIRRINDTSSKVEVRAGTVEADKDLAQKILSKIESSL